MKIEKLIKETFVVIGKEGSTMDGQGFIQKLGSYANSHFSEVQPLAKKDENGNLVGIWGAMSDFPIHTSPGKIASAKVYTLLVLNVLTMQKHPRDGQNGQFQAMSIFVQRLKAEVLFQMCWTT